jgi:MTH538 TIR-like domain (DUF1863)
VIQLSGPLPHYKFWAFISYSRNDESWAKSLHRRLEGYRVPRRIRPVQDSDVPSADRLRPVFRDQDELAASADLGARLRDALDRSRYLIVLASRASAKSKWVNAEVRHLIDANRANDILIMVIDGEPGRHPGRGVLPEALNGLAEEPLWVDARRSAKPSRSSFLRLVAGMLGVGFDALWQRDRRRRRFRFAAWMASIALVAGSTGTVIWRQQMRQEENKPERQVAAFREFFVADILKTARGLDPTFDAVAVDFEILRTDDLNRDSLVDFFVFNKTEGFCGSGGCDTQVYLSEGRGRYRVILDLFSSTTPRTRSNGSGRYKEILATDYRVDGYAVYSVFKWADSEYRLSHYEFCGRVDFEYCDPREFRVMITPVDGDRLSIAPGAAYRSAPDPNAALSSWTVQNSSGSVIGEVAGGQWYLVEIWKGESAFVSRQEVHRR